MKYIISVDQSTQGTKALLFDESGALIRRTDLSHAQIINEKGWVSHDGEEIYRNTLQVIKNLVEESGIDKGDVVGLGISNQRETSLIWDRTTGKPLAHAVVWQCARTGRYLVELFGDGEISARGEMQISVGLADLFHVQCHRT